jgi:chromosome partitioning protein
VSETVACANQKGGVGKTTTVVNLATYLALAGRSVLVVDLDPQGNATSGLGVDRAAVARSTYDALTDDVAVDELIVDTPIPRLRLLPSAMALAGAEVELAAMAQRERRLGRALGRINEAFEHVLIDCPPSLGLLTVNGLTAADQVLIPLQCEYYALEGLNQLIATINLIRDHLNPALTIKGVLLTMYDARTKLAADVAAEARRYLGDRVFLTSIPRSVRLSEAPSYGQPIAVYRPDSAGAEAYRSVTEEYLHRQGIDVTVPSAAVAPSGSIGADRPDPVTEQLGAA